MFEIPQRITEIGPPRIHMKTCALMLPIDDILLGKCVHTITAAAAHDTTGNATRAKCMGHLWPVTSLSLMRTDVTVSCV